MSATASLSFQLRWKLGGALPLLALAALLVVAPKGQASSYSEVIAHAVEMCKALAPGHEAELGNSDPEEVSHWFRQARWEASQRLWNDAGVRRLKKSLRESHDALTSACLRQLLEEARTKAEAPLTYSPTPSG